MKKITLAALAHVDAGKTTLSEGLLYRSGQIDRAGRVDHGDTSLDTNFLERSRGITIFSHQTRFFWGETQCNLMDTPGHVDFSSEMERTLSVLDYAILVISGTAGIQAHTATLWQLLKGYEIPVFLFVTKMDIPTADKEQVLSQLKARFGDGFVDFSEKPDPEALAESDEGLLEEYLESGTVSDSAITESIARRNVFPVWFGSGLKLTGLDGLLDGLDRYTREPDYPAEFSARVFKISRDEQGNRLTFLKLTGGNLAVKQSISYLAKNGEKKSEKINQLRFYEGKKFTQIDSASAGDVVAVTGLSATRPGQGLGCAPDAPEAVLTPALCYRIGLPQGMDAREALPKLSLLSEEDPQLSIVWNEHLSEIQAMLMGETQIQILQALIRDRFDFEVTVDSGRILYRETIAAPVEGAGHFEPLRHYAEVHLLLEPLEPGSGIVLDSVCSEDSLDRNWQRLILTHLCEKTHLGVLTGSPITDMKITLTAGRAHEKHTEGGDFRQATYRALRQGLMKAESVLLEPFYAFTLEVPANQTGRAVNDIRAMCGTFECLPTEDDTALLQGTAPVSSMNGYATQVLSYTGGKGKLSCRVAGYQPCHNTEEVVAAEVYDPESDLENTPDSVFCAHGAGFTVKWREADDYMHLEGYLKKHSATPGLRRYNLNLDEKELEEIMLREFGPIKRPLYRRPVTETVTATVEIQKKREYVLVDGYNMIHAWPELKAMAEANMGDARKRLCDLLANYAGYTDSKLVAVFDGYAVKDNPGEKLDHHGIHVVFTRQNETADLYMEKLVRDIGKNFSVRVVTSDHLIRLTAIKSGVLRTGAADFVTEVDWVYRQIEQAVEKSARNAHTRKISEEDFQT